MSKHNTSPAPISPADAARRLTAELARRGVQPADVVGLAVAGEGDADGVRVWRYTVQLAGGRSLTVKIA